MKKRLVYLIGILSCAWALAQSSPALPPVKPRPDPKLTKEEEKELNDSVFVGSQADSFTQCSQLISTYGSYFLRHAPGTDDKRKLHDNAKACLENSGNCNPSDFIKALSYAAQSKDIRRILLTCNSSYMDLRSHSWRMDKPETKDLPPQKFNIKANGWGEAKGLDKNPYNFTDVAGSKAFEEKAKHHSFKFSEKVVNAYAKDVANIDNETGVGPVLRNYMGFALEAMGAARANIANGSATIGASTTAPNNQNPKATPGAAYDREAVQISQIGDKDKKDFEILKRFDPTENKGGRKPAANEIMEGPLDKTLSTASKNQSQKVSEIVEKYIKEEDLDNPNKANVKNGDINDPTGIHRRTRNGDDIADFNKDIDKTYEAEIARRKANRTFDEKTRLVLVANEQQFRDFLNEIWPTSISTPPKP